MMPFNQLKKNLKKNTEGLKSVRLAILSDSSSQLLTQAIKGYGIENAVDYKIFEADYNQIDRQVFDFTSELYLYQPEFILILRSSEKLLKTFYEGEQNPDFADKQIAYVESLYTAIALQTKAKIITNTFIELNDGVLGNYATKVPSSFIYQIRKINFLLMNTCQQLRNLFLLDLANIATTKGYDLVCDPKMYVQADMVFSIDVLPLVAKNVHDIIGAINGTFKKCVILDLDNTIWGGIIGDDGMEGIQIGHLGLGKIFTEFQLWIKALVRRGIIIAVCSKNTEAIAKEPFLHHPEMILRLEDIALFVANWENKADNIHYIQSVLNIGFDSMVFLDDNPFERDMVKQAIPDLEIPSLPDDPAEYLQYLRNLNLFETASFAEEDGQRTKQYQEEAKRTIVQQSFTNEEDFLKSLNMSSEVKAFDAFTIPRIAQLSLRSNQFNLRTIRYTEEDIKLIATSEKFTGLSFSLKDIYGDYGLIAFVILEKKERGILFIDSWIMSCRVLKRGMELFILQSIVDIAIEKGCEKIVGEYIATKKNAIVEELYQQLGFTKTIEGLWELSLSENPNIASNCIYKSK